MFVGDALAMPVHWYYGGPEQIRRDFGGFLLSGYERAVHPFPESIMQLSNTGGGGRGGDEGEVVGSVILHGKKKYWRRGGGYHYHHTLDAGENTLEASLARVLMRSIIANKGEFIPDDFRRNYISFMTTPGTHNDTYASTCHRLFFKNWQAGVVPEACPDNDGHNVDAIDGLVLPVVVALAEFGAGSTSDVAATTAVQALAVTRKSTALPDYVSAYTQMLAAVIAGTPLRKAAEDLARMSYGGELAESVRQRGDHDPMVACYIGGSFPAILHFAYKYAGLEPKAALLASANAGGENVHRGLVFGALVGAAAGLGAFPAVLRDGLRANMELGAEIEAFVEAVRLRAGRPEL